MSPGQEVAEPHPPRGAWRLIAIAVAAVAIAAFVVIFGNPFAASGGASDGHQGNSYPTQMATVLKQNLTSQTAVNGTLGYAGDYNVVNQAAGTFTALPAAGDIVRSGDVLYRLDGRPVVLLAGSTPGYRELSWGMKGADVGQLNAALVALGYASRSELSPSSQYFGAATYYALRELQDRLGLDETGTLPLGQAVFLPSPLRVTKLSAQLGTSAAPGAVVGQATSARHEVVVDLDAAQQSLIKSGDKVTATLPNGSSTPGIVTSVGKVATASSDEGKGATIPVRIKLRGGSAARGLDQAPVQVLITTDRAEDALVVPVSSLLALSGGGYAVEVVGADGAHRLVPVTTGLFDDSEGLVEVTGKSLAAGQRIVVPGA